MFEKKSSVAYERMFQNLRFLESRNPDLSLFLKKLDSWLENFVSVLPTADESLFKTNLKESGLREKTTLHEKVASLHEKEENDPKMEIADSGEVGDAAKEVAAEGKEFSSQDYAETSTAGDLYRRESSSGNLLDARETEQLEKRLMLKIEASRWALERDKLLKSNIDFQTEIEPKDHALLARARELKNCYLWMNNPETAPVMASETYELLADAYAVAARCVGFMRKLVEMVDKSPKSEMLSRILRDALYITATAQSALRRVTYEVSGREDQDQIRIHRWLTLLTKRYSIYVNRHMKKNSLAPIEKIYVIPEYIKRLEEELTELEQKQKILTEGFRRIQFHASRINEQQSNEYDWNRIILTVDELVDAGIRPTDSRFQELLEKILPYLKQVPSYQEHPFFVNVLLELDYWKNDIQQLEIIKRELALSPPCPRINPDRIHMEFSSSFWNDQDEDSEEQEREVPEKPVAVVTPPVEVEKKPSDSFGAGILEDITESSENEDSSSADSISPAKIPFRIPFGRPASGGVPSYASVVSEYATETKSDAEWLEEAQKMIGGRVVVLVDGEGDTTLKSCLEESMKMRVCFANADLIRSESLLAQQAHPEEVAVVLMVDGSIPTANRNVENYCRHFDKPLLRVSRSSTVASIARQIQAALSLYG
ncbi:MAG: hypothetical protein Q4D62_04895 [Planctomycetia bacterium]|nr:hypothetical protein [Planctomycetia bacterium]